jgi:SNF2 family DNA or RNA helicase
MTGSPTPNAPTDAWAQCRLVTPNNPRVPRYFGAFRDTVMRQVSPFKWVARDTANAVVSAMMQPSIRFALDDCIDLPEQTFINRDVELSPEQSKAFKTMLNTLAAEYKGGQIFAVNEAVKASKLIQISCGVAYGVNGELVEIPSAPRLEVLKEIIDEAEGKVICFVPLTGALESVARTLRQSGIKVEVVHGATSKADRDRIFGDFQRSADPRVIVANAGTMSHGLTLTAASVIVWYAPVYSNEIYEQACARMRRPGQQKTTVIVHIAGTEVERRVYQRLQAKQSMQGLLLDMIKELQPASLQQEETS